MKSRIYSSRFYPAEYFSLIITTSNNIFDDLEKSNAERVAHQKTKAEIKHLMTDEHYFAIRQIDSSKIHPQESKITSAMIVGDGARFRTVIQEEGEQNKRTSDIQRKKTTIFSLVYENGEKRNVEALNGSYLFRFLISKCRKV